MVNLRALLAVAALLASCAGSCTRTVDCQDAVEEGSGFAQSCAAAPHPVAAPAGWDCAGPDADGWSNQPRPDDAGPCPPPPAGGCAQVVLGRLSDTARYVGCPGYIVLNRSDWTIELNDAFIACVAACELGTCDPAVIVVSGREEIPDFDVDYTRTTVTSRELCELINAGCVVTFADASGPGLVDCGCSTSAGAPGP